MAVSNDSLTRRRMFINEAFGFSSPRKGEVGRGLNAPVSKAK